MFCCTSTPVPGWPACGPNFFNAGGRKCVGAARAVGGEGGEQPLGNPFLVGFTQSVNFPSVRPIRGACFGTCSKKLAANVFVVNVNAAGSVLVYSSVIGGSASDQGHGIAVDSLGNALFDGLHAIG